MIFILNKNYKTPSHLNTRFMDLTIAFHACDAGSELYNINFIEPNNKEIVSSLKIRGIEKMMPESRMEYYIDNIHELTGKSVPLLQGNVGYCYIAFNENDYEFSSTGGEFTMELSVKVKRTKENNETLKSFFKEILKYQ